MICALEVGFVLDMLSNINIYTVYMFAKLNIIEPYHAMPH